MKHVPVRLTGTLVAAVVAALGLILPAAASAASVPVVSTAQPHLTVIGAAPHVDPAAHEVGSLGGSTPLAFDVVLKPRDPAALTRAIAAVSDPSSPQYHHFIARGQFAGLYGPLPSTIVEVRSVLSSLGLSVGTTTSDGLIVHVHATAARIESALHTHFTAYRIAGRVAHTNTQAPSIPASIASYVQDITGLDSVDVPQPLEVRNPAAHVPTNAASEAAIEAAETGSTSRVAAPHVSGAANCSSSTLSQQAIDWGAYTACQIAQVYGFTSAYNSGDLGSGETIGLYEEEPYTTSDVSAFEQTYGISTSVTAVNVDGGPGHTQQRGEAALDIDNVVSLAPEAHVIVYQGNPNDDSNNIWETIADADVAQVVSTSWGLCESENGGLSAAQSEEEFFEQAAMQGQTILAAAGDSGSEDCYDQEDPPADTDSSLQVDDPGSQPYVTSVGGTSLTSASPQAEVVWNNCQGQGTSCGTGSGNSGAGAGGGGISSNWTMPSWQTGTGVVNSFSSSSPCSGGSTDCREVPDVSADADPDDGYLSYFQGSWGGAGGTSAAAPVWAAVVALADEACSSTSGLINPTVYALMASHPSDLHDITSGNNDFTGTHNGDYPATTGYDMASGWGTPTSAMFEPGALCGTTSPTTTTTTSTTTVPATTTTTSLPGTTTTTTRPGSTTTLVPSAPSAGYWMLASNGNVYNYGSAGALGSATGVGSPAVGMAATPGGEGYWIAFSNGTVKAFGDAPSLAPSSKPSGVVTIAATPDGDGYWLATASGQIVTAGDAYNYGSPASLGLNLNAPIVNMVPTPDGGGYWILAGDGGVFAFGDATFYGSTGSIHLNAPAVAMAPTVDGKGYWFVASDGGIFTFGDAAYYGSMGGIPLAKPVNGIVVTSGGAGYWMVASDGGVFTFGDATFIGSLGGQPIPAPIVAFAPA